MAKKEVKTKQAFDCLSVTAVQVYPFKEKIGNMLGIATVVLNDQLSLTGVRIMDGVNGMFVGYPPSTLNKGELPRSAVFPITRALREHIENCVLEKYQYEMANPSLKYEVELTHQELSGASLQMEIIAASETEAESKAKERAIEIIPATKDSKEEWVVLKVQKHE